MNELRKIKETLQKIYLKYEFQFSANDVRVFERLLLTIGEFEKIIEKTELKIKNNFSRL